MNEKPTLLIADDDLALCALLVEYLQNENFNVDVTHNGLDALARISNPKTRPDLLILDVMMPQMDGLETLRKLRTEFKVPVIMLSARGEPVDKIIGLELGADDYLAKPALPRELLARIRARLRHAGNGVAADEEITIGDLQLIPASRSATVHGTELELTAAEFSLLLALGRELERFDRSIDVHVSRLRHKLAEAETVDLSIEAVRGAGYQLMVNRT